MMENKANAIKKINDEIQAENDRYTQVIGYYLLRELKKECNLNATKDIADEVKNIKGCLIAMKSEAEKKITKHNGIQVAVLTDSEAFEIVNKYFNLNGYKDTDLIVKNEKNKSKHNEKAIAHSEKEKSKVVAIHKIDGKSNKSTGSNEKTEIKGQLQFNI